MAERQREREGEKTSFRGGERVFAEISLPQLTAGELTCSSGSPPLREAALLGLTTAKCCRVDYSSICRQLGVCLL